MIQGLSTIANIVLSSALLASKTQCVMTTCHHLSRRSTMKKTIVALLITLGLGVVVKVVANKI